jgi:hypothetical protein
MKIKRRHVFSVTLLLLIIPLASTAAVMPALGKDMNVPEGTEINYYTGGYGVINLPTTLTIPIPGGSYVVDKIRIIGVHIETGSIASGDYIIVHFLPNNTPKTPFVPWAVFTTITDSNFLTFWRTLTAGTPVYMKQGSITVFDNVYSIPGGLTVDRHGNSVTINFAADQKIKIVPGATPVYFTLPAFTMELNKVGGSAHIDQAITATGYPGASGWTETNDRMGFYPEGTFTCSAWSPVERPVTEGFITMHGIATYTPP